MSAAVWYFAKNNEQKGPVSQAELEHMLGSRELPADTLIWAATLSNWTPANQVEAFAAFLSAQQSAPPAPPAPSPAAAAPQAVSHAEDPSLSGFETEPAAYQFEQPAANSYQFGVDPMANEPPMQPNTVSNAAQSYAPTQEGLSAEEQSAALRQIVAHTPPPSAGGNKWGDLDSIPTPKPTSSAFNPSELDQIGRNSSSRNPAMHAPAPSPEPNLVESDEPSARSGGLGDSGRLRKLMHGSGAVDTASYTKGTGSHIGRGAFSNLPHTPHGQQNAIAAAGEGDVTYPHPWHRYWARCIDDTYYCIPAMLFILVLPSSMNMVAAFLGLVAKLAVEAVVIGKFSTSLGKRAFNIRVRDEATMQPLTMEQAAKRTLWLGAFAGWWLTWFSWGFCIWQYFNLTGKGKSSWDEKMGIRYEHHPFDDQSKVFLVSTIIGCFVIHGIFGAIYVTKVWATIANMVPK